MGDEISRFLHRRQACRAGIRLPHRSLCPVQEVFTQCPLQICTQFLLHLLERVHLTSFKSFPHSFQLSSKLSLLLDVLMQAVDLCLKVLGKLFPL